MEWCSRIGKYVRYGQANDFSQLPEKAVVDHASDGSHAAESHRAGDNLRNKIRSLLARGEHPPSFVCIARHASFRQYMLAGFQGGQCDGAVQIGPRADDYGVDIGIADQLFPVAVSFGDGIFVGCTLSRFSAPVDDSDNLDLRTFPQPANVLEPAVSA